jgi:hypothetical protein
VYRCESCGDVVAPGTRAHRRVVRWRAVNYPRRTEVHRRRTPGGKDLWIDDPGGTGVEIAAEQRVCPRCAEAPVTT